MNLVSVWMNIPSYQSDLFESLYSHGANIEVIYARKSDESREKLGWKFSHKNEIYSVYVISEIGWLNMIRYLLKNRSRRHIFNGIWAEPAFLLAMTTCFLFGISYYVYSEAPVPFLKRSRLKRFILNIIVRPYAKLLLSKVKGVFSVASFGYQFYKGLGVSDNINFPFGYFRNVVPAHKLISSEEKDFKLIYVGQLIERKGIKPLLEGLNEVINHNISVTLSIVGTGPLEKGLKQYVAEFGLTKNVQFEGVVESQNITNRIARADILVLPSQFDGWGLVVNEALQSGVPVLVSDQCGAAELIIDGYNGAVFRSGDVHDLSHNLLSLLKADLTVLKENALKTGELITPEVAARYLLDCLAYSDCPSVPPVAPWKKVNPS